MAKQQATYEFLNPYYQKHMYRWKKVEDCVLLDVKDCDWYYALNRSQYGVYSPSANDYWQSSVYLPYPDNTGEAERNYKRYVKYIQRAIFAAYTKRTHDGFLGMVYRNEPVIEIPDSMQDWANDASGTGLNLMQISKENVSNGAKYGRSAIYVSYPATEEGMSAEQTAMLQPILRTYRAQDIINWNIDNSLIVLREAEAEPEDEFDTSIYGGDGDYDYQYRVLRLRDGVAISQLYKDGFEGEEIILTDGFGNTFDYIPFHWVGTVNNDNKIDESLLEGIADLNIGHYRNSADLEENCFIHGQGTMFISSNMSWDDWQRANPDGVTVGSNAGHFIGENGSASLLQADPNQIADNLMKRKEDQMVQLGAAVMGANNFQSATEAEINASTESANLVSLVDNVSLAMQSAIYDAARYAGVAVDMDSIVFDLNKEFYPATVTAQETMAYIQLYDRGIIGNEELRNPLRKEGIVSRDDSEIDEEVASRGLTI